MESPISYIGAEIFLQQYDRLILEHTLHTNKLAY